MAKVSELLSQQDLAKIANLQVLARLVVEGAASGLHRSPHKGFSVEFKQHRPYVHGDEVRRLDWKLFGKTDRFYLREYEEETNLRATILLDQSGSMNYTGTTSNGMSKAQYGTRLAACLAYLMLQQRDSVGLVSFDTKVRKYVPPRSRPGHLRNLIDAMQADVVGGETELGKVFHEMAAKIHRRGLLIIISDLFSNVTELMSALAHFRHARHEIIVFQIWDRDELDFNFRQWTKFECLEVSGRHHMVDPAALRSAYQEELESFREELKKGCHRHRIDLVSMCTDEPYAAALAHYLALRRKRN